MKKLVLGAVMAIACISEAAAERRVITPSGQPDVTFPSATLEQASGQIVSLCMNRGWQVVSQTTNQVVCEIPQNFGTTLVQQLLLGNSYSTTPRTFTRVSLAQVGANVRAQAAAWAETQMAFGQVRQHQYTDDATMDNLTMMLATAGGELPAGTRFTGTYLGIEGTAQVQGRTATLPVRHVYANSTAAEAGLQVGDVITKLRNRTFQNEEEFTGRLNRIRNGERFPLTVRRNGQELTLNLVSRARPSVGSAEYEALRNEARDVQARLGQESTPAVSAAATMPSESGSAPVTPPAEPGQPSQDE